MECASLLALSVKLALLANRIGSVTPQQAAAGESGKKLAAVQGACGTGDDRVWVGQKSIEWLFEVRATFPNSTARRTTVIYLQMEPKNRAGARFFGLTPS
ncbi:MAG: hypothetical protein JJT75_11910 [Opitutales bacterium]|nr:hypothetical protein [Opitutales bacterium]